MKMTGEHHIESHRLFELAQMSRSIDQTDWEHIWNCVECGTAFLMLKSVLLRNNPQRNYRVRFRLSTPKGAEQDYRDDDDLDDSDRRPDCLI